MDHLHFDDTQGEVILGDGIKGRAGLPVALATGHELAASLTLTAALVLVLVAAEPWPEVMRQMVRIRLERVRVRSGSALKTGELVSC